MKTFTTADLHFGHRKLAILRGFLRKPNLNPDGTEEIMNIDEIRAGISTMDETIIEDFNSTVNKNDVTYIIGDFSFHNDNTSIEILKRLNGTLILIEGNHDRKRNKLLREFSKVEKLLEFKFSASAFATYHIVMCHYPMLIWNKHHHGSIHLHGHSHGNLMQVNPDYYKRRVMDVGVDAQKSYKPLLLNNICEILGKNFIEKVDHHYNED